MLNKNDPVKILRDTLKSETERINNLEKSINETIHDAVIRAKKNKYLNRE